ncbi:membrane protein [Candidatus Magnetobacterium bavaricum]|uniref:Membrane protein n=1 Tax=Candidatus Magnetobacterium bavaricum TaxID=29290 RepID=A0A0F3GW04_9BACT|nr:membrane protein [Candidatus Magnetobacterium bavaricum]
MSDDSVLILMGVLSGWLPIYPSMVFVIKNKWLKDGTIYTFLEIAIGVMLCHFVATCSSVFHTHHLLSPPQQIILSSTGFILGAGILMAYVTLRDALWIGPEDVIMMEEFDNKLFFLDPTSSKKRRFNIHALRYDLALCYAIHSVGAGVAFFLHLNSKYQGTYGMTLLPYLLFTVIEGLSIAAPIARFPLSWPRVLIIGSIAGVPFVFGAGLGSVNLSTSFIVFLSSLSAGSLFYCIIMLMEMISMNQRSDKSPLFTALRVLLFFLISSFLHQGMHNHL